MMEYRFKEIKSYVPYLWANGEQKEQGDPWWQFNDAVTEFNKNRAKVVMASRELNNNESMSALHPRTTKTGNLPHLSMILCKPELLGTELR